MNHFESKIKKNSLKQGDGKSSKHTSSSSSLPVNTDCIESSHKVWAEQAFRIRKWSQGNFTTTCDENMRNSTSTSTDSISRLLKSAAIQTDETHVSISVSSSFEDDVTGSSSEHCYSMATKTKGICVIVNNFDYCQSEGILENRLGSDADQHALETTFRNLGFYVKVFKNLEASEIFDYLRNVAIKDHSNYSCFACCILAHGTNDAIYGVDGREQKVKELLDQFIGSKNDSLKDKPKLFFIQACRSHHNDNNSLLLKTDAVNLQNYTSVTPDHADFLVGYACVEGSAAQRHPEVGSLYIQNLCKTINERAKCWDLVSILTQVNDRVSGQMFVQHGEQTTGVRFHQMPEVKHTLRKKIFL